MATLTFTMVRIRHIVRAARGGQGAAISRADGGARRPSNPNPNLNPNPDPDPNPDPKPDPDPDPDPNQKLLSEAIDNSKGPMLRPSGEGAAASPGGPRQAAGGAAGGGRALSDVERLEAMMGGPAAGEGPPPPA